MKLASSAAPLLLALGLLTASGCRQTTETAAPSPSGPNKAQARAAQASEDDAPLTPANNPKEFKAGIVVPVGTIGYRVESSQFADKLADGATPTAGRKFLLVKLTTRNTGPKASPFAAFSVIDGNTTYDLSGKGNKEPGALNEVRQLAQDELRNGVLVFETPPSKGLKLKIAAAPPVKDEMFINLSQEPVAVKSPAANK